MKKTVGYAYLRESKTLPDIISQREHTAFVMRNEVKRQIFYIEKVSGNLKIFESLKDRIKSSDHQAVLYIWSLEVIAPLFTDIMTFLKFILTLKAANCDLVSINENIDTRGDVHNFLKAVVNVFENSSFSFKKERQRNALLKLVEKGQRIGRPPTNDIDEEKVKVLREAGETLRSIANKLGVSVSSVHRILAAE